MEDIGLTVLKWVLILWPKIPQMPQNLSAQFVCSSTKVLDFNEKKASLSVLSPWMHPTTVLATSLHLIIGLLVAFSTMDLSLYEVATFVHNPNAI